MEISDTTSSVQCDVCKKMIKGSYQELNGVVHCDDCADVVQKAIGKFILILKKYNNRSINYIFFSMFKMS